MRARFVLVGLVVLSLLGIGTADPARAASDTTPPVLHSISLASPGPFTAGDTVTLQWHATDDIGLQQVQVRFRDAVGHRRTVVAYDGAAAVSVPIDYRWANGAATLLEVVLYDVNGNFAMYLRDGTLFTSGGTTHAVDLSRGDFNTFGTGEDVTAPTLEAFSMATPASRTVGDPVTLAWSVADEHAYWFHAVYEDAACKQHSLYGSAGATGPSTATVDGSWGEGAARLIQVIVDDDAGNTRVYRPDGSTTSYTDLNEPGAPGSHGYAFGAFDVVAHDTGADVEPPALTSLSLGSQGPFREGDSLSYAWGATDASGSAAISVSLVDAAGKGHSVQATSMGAAASASVDASWAPGRAVVMDVQLYDQLGNHARLFRDGRLWYERQACRPQGSHEFDLSLLDIDIEPSSVPSGSPSPTGSGTPDPSPSPTATATPTPIASVEAPAPTASPTANVAPTPTPTQTAAPTPTPTVSPTSSSPGDSTAPTATTTAPTQPFTLLASPVLAWSGSDSGSGVASYDVRVNTATLARGFAGWTSPPSWQGLTVTRKAASLSPGTTLCFAVRAHDLAGNVGGWSATRCVSRAADDRLLRLSGGWYRGYLSSLYGGSAVQTTRYGAAAATPTVTVRRVALVATTCPSCGSVGVYVGGTLVGKVSLVSSTLQRRRVLAVPLIALRTGAVSVRVLTSGRAVEVDGIVLARV